MITPFTAVFTQGITCIYYSDIIYNSLIHLIIVQVCVIIQTDVGTVVLLFVTGKVLQDGCS